MGKKIIFISVIIILAFTVFLIIPKNQHERRLYETSPDEEKLANISKAAMPLPGTPNLITFEDASIGDEGVEQAVGVNGARVNYNVLNFSDNDSLIRDTSKISSTIFQEILVNNLNIEDIVVIYYDNRDTIYQRDKPSDIVKIYYAVNKKTLSKIDWTNFNPINLCNFLKHENQINREGVSDDINCKVYD